MCNICRYVRRTKQDQYACFSCRLTKNVCRKMAIPKQFWFLADGVPYLYNTQRHKSATAKGDPKCSNCAIKMIYVGPHFKGPSRRKLKIWDILSQQYLSKKQ